MADELVKKDDEFVQSGTSGDVVTQSVLSDKSKTTTALLAFFFGGLGAHRFYVGKMNSGIILLVIWLTGLALNLFFLIGLFIVWIPLWIWSMIDFVRILTGNFNDAEGRKLK